MKSEIDNDEKRLLISRAAELSARGRNFAVASPFLTPGEQRIVFENCDTSQLFLWGGYRGAERRMAIFLPSWLDFPTKHDSAGIFSEERENIFIEMLRASGMTDILGDFISPIKLCGSKTAKLSHSDWLGALMALGIKRSVAGDISVESGADATLFCEKKCAGYITSELQRAGRESVCASMIADAVDFSLGYTAKRNFLPIAATVASMRADGVIRALCNVSREDAAELVAKGSVQINYKTAQTPDKKILPGDIISVRGYGKYIIDRGEDLTRRGRIRLESRKYV